MKCLKRCAAVAAMMLVGAAAAFAQIVVDPLDRLYTDMGVWQDRGLVANLPPLRPYPVQVFRRLLQDVLNKGEPEDRARAEAYLREISAPVTLHGEASGLVRMDLNSYPYIQLGVEAQVQGGLGPMMTYSGSLGELATNGLLGTLLPAYVRPEIGMAVNLPPTPTNIEPNSTNGGGIALGTDTLYFSAGVARSSYGPFFGDSLVLSPYAPETGSFAVVWRQDLFTYTQLLLGISATRNDGGGGRLPNKYLGFHSLEIRPWPWLALGAFESIVWGDRFEPIYLLPMPALFAYTQGLHDFSDNLLVGLSGSAMLPGAVRSDFLFLLDDAGIGDLMLLRFNTMLKIAVQGGISWTPNLPFLTKLSVEYLLITPYTYSHREGSDLPSELNYQNYTNGGENMGPSLQPNSDRLEVNVLVRSLPFLDLTLFGRFVRHGNASEGIPGGGDGTIYDTGYVGGHATFTPEGGFTLPAGMLWTRFLTQAVIERTFQAGFDARVFLETPVGCIGAVLSYTFEYAWNAGLGPTDAMKHYLALGTHLRI